MYSEVTSGLKKKIIRPTDTLSFYIPHINNRHGLQHESDTRCLPPPSCSQKELLLRNFHSWKEDKEIFEDNYFQLIETHFN